MKREILFKAKRVDNNEWVCGNLYIPNQLLRDSYISLDTTYFNFYPDLDEDDESSTIENQEPGISIGKFIAVQPETVCQFTGLLDKNGNKIFEGDIVKKTILNDFRDFIVLFYVDGFTLQRTNSIEAYHQKSIRSPKRINYKDWQQLLITSNIHDK